MIRIEKHPEPPLILSNRGVAQTESNKAAYDNHRDDYLSGDRKFNFHRAIYGAANVKETLLKAQHDKCCYCESKFRSTSYGHVEHYRPKGAVTQGDGADKERPGYYWLAYDWDNLLVSCEVCNTGKGIQFPLADNTARVRDHHEDVAHEQPLLIHPAKIDPREHIRFHREEPVPLSDTYIGRRTIDVLRLRRDALLESRRESLKKLKRLRDLVFAGRSFDDACMQGLIEEAREKLRAAVRPEAEFSSMAQDLLSS